VNYNSLEQCKHKEKMHEEVKRNRPGDEEAAATLKA
jgi:hypothetical protein